MTDEQYQNYLSKASRLCARNEKCEQDIRKKLNQWGVENEEVRNIIHELKDSGFIDHQRYASAFVRDKVRFNHWGRNKIAHALRAKNIEEPVISEALEQISPQQYEKALLEEMEKKNRTIKSSDQRERRNKLIQFLLQKGFEYGKVFELVDEKMEGLNKEDHGWDK